MQIQLNADERGSSMKEGTSEEADNLSDSISLLKVAKAFLQRRIAIAQSCVSRACSQL